MGLIQIYEIELEQRDRGVWFLSLQSRKEQQRAVPIKGNGNSRKIIAHGKLRGPKKSGKKKTKNRKGKRQKFP